MSATRGQRIGLLVVLLLAAALRLVLALVLYPGAGFAPDMASFQEWAYAFARSGPSRFYLTDRDANYPPVSILMLGGLQQLSGPVAALTGGTAGHALVVLLKLPAVLADVVGVGLVYLLARELQRPSVALFAAGLYAVVPPIWYVSALWGQIDSVMIMFSAAALLALCRRLHTLAALAAVLAMMVKPQGVLILLVVVVVVLADLRTRDARIRSRTLRLLIAAVPAAVLLLGLLSWFRYRTVATVAAGIPVVGDVAGFVQQAVATGQLFPVLTANAFNGWALVDRPSLAASIGTGRALWWPDSGGAVPYALIGLAALLVTLLLVVVGLVRRHDATAILFGYTVLAFAFYAFPTRSHERYLLPVFVGAAALAAAGLVRAIAFLLTGLLNLVNLHAVLAAPLSTLQLQPGQSAPSDGGFSGGGRPSGGGPPGGGGFGGGSGGSGAGSSQPQQIALPWADQARAEQVVAAVSVAQLAIGICLVLGWVIFVVRSGRGGATPRTGG